MALIKAEDNPNLTAKQSAFVDAYVANGGNGAAAAREAGYSEKSARIEGHRLLRNPLIVKEVYERTVIALGASLPRALETVSKLSTEANSEYVRLEAAKDLLDRAGLKAPDRVEARLSGDFKVSIDLS